MMNLLDMTTAWASLRLMAWLGGLHLKVRLTRHRPPATPPADPATAFLHRYGWDIIEASVEESLPLLEKIYISELKELSGCFDALERCLGLSEEGRGTWVTMVKFDESQECIVHHGSRWEAVIYELNRLYAQDIRPS